MSLVTRCPNCDTTFKVTLPQLQAHRGDVRCGRCAQVFDAFADLSTVQDTDEAPADNGPDSVSGGANDQWAEDALAGRSEAASDNDSGGVSA
ncbi:MAG: zinc-ribbon domain-containing protein, partial [Burkholderiales bacterium]|nr:zinc-ribbon domain-containing protein [Burkholderiales bacterium]